MLFKDYEETNVIYHIITLKDLKKALKDGIHYDDKWTYTTKYSGFHQFIDLKKTENIPEWVVRRRAIFASMNYPKGHKFHSHSAILSIKVNPKRCWIANENCANQIYEPYILKDIEEFSSCENYLKNEGKELLKKYWETSLSFEENLKERMDKKEGYDAEVLVLHNIMPKDIKILYIISDHRMMKVEDWEKHFCM